jgi:hypothetical protein
MDSQALNPNRKVDYGKHLRRLTGAMMAQRVEDMHEWSPHDHSDTMDDPVFFMNVDTDVRRTREENMGGRPYSDSGFVREEAGRAFRNRRELRQKYGHIAKF